MQRDQQVVAAFIQQRLVGQGAGGDDASHLPLHWPFAGSGIAYLFADRHRQTEFHQLGQIVFHRMKGDARHWNRLARRLAARGEGDIKQFGGANGVVIEHLVEIAHPVEQQNAGMLGLDAQVLLHHRGVGGQIGNGFSRSFFFHGNRRMRARCVAESPAPRLYENLRWPRLSVGTLPVIRKELIRINPPQGSCIPLGKNSTNPKGGSVHTLSMLEVSLSKVLLSYGVLFSLRKP